jgi:hypothetical protein
MWDCNGFEVLKECSSWENQSLLDTLAGRPLKQSPINLQAMIMRARYNPHRNYEIWTFNTEENLNEDTLWSYAKNNLQELIAMIQLRGKKLYGIEKYKDFTK